MQFLWRKQNDVESRIEDYISETELCMSSFAGAFDVYFSEGLSAMFEELVKQTHGHESMSDDKRRQIEQSLYQGTLIPELRGDLLGMLESLDTIPNQCETVLNQLLLEAISIPSAYLEDFRKLVAVNVESHRHICDAARYVLTDRQRVLGSGAAVDAKESEADRIEQTMLKNIFRSDMDTADKILLRDLILEISGISDRAENAADRITIIAIKHHS